MTSSVLLWARGQPVFELIHAPLYPSDVEVHIMGKIRAHTWLGVSERAVESSPAHTDHYGSQAQQKEQQPRVSAHLICILDESKLIQNQNILSLNSKMSL